MDITALGYLAGFLTTITAIPQAIKAFQTKQTEDISMGMFICYSLGVSAWCLYGFLIGDMPVFITSLFELVPVLLVIYLKLRYDIK